MSPKIESSGKTTGTTSAALAADAAKKTEGSAYEPPPLPTNGGFEGLGIESLAAMLAVESAHEMKKLMGDLEKAAKQSQVDALNQQVDALRGKADDMRGEGMLAGAFIIGGGAATIGSAVAAIPASESSKVDPKMPETPKTPEPGAGAAQPTTPAAGGSAPAGASASASTTNAEGKFNVGDAIGRGLGPLGTTLSAFGPNLAKATYGAAQVNDDANATKHAADAKFAENARDEYAALAREARATIDKAEQALQSFVQERTAAKRAILRI
jgi:hypothetical protein